MSENQEKKLFMTLVKRIEIIEKTGNPKYIVKFTIFLGHFISLKICLRFLLPVSVCTYNFMAKYDKGKNWEQIEYI